MSRYSIAAAALPDAGCCQSQKPKLTLESADTNEISRYKDNSGRSCCQKQLIGQACCIDREFQVGS